MFTPKPLRDVSNYVKTSGSNVRSRTSYHKKVKLVILHFNTYRKIPPRAPLSSEWSSLDLSF